MKKIPVQCCNDWVLIKRERETHVGRIIIPDKAQKQQIARVLNVGPGRYSDRGIRIPMTLKEGDWVILGNYTGKDVEVDGETYTFLPEIEVQAILERDEKDG